MSNEQELRQEPATDHEAQSPGDASQEVTDDVEKSRVERAIRRARQKAEQREHIAAKHEALKKRQEEKEAQRLQALRQYEQPLPAGMNGDEGQPLAASSTYQDGPEIAHILEETTAPASAESSGEFEYGYRSSHVPTDELITDAHGNPINVTDAMLDKRRAAEIKTSTPHLAFYSPRIPGNTGSAIRLCAVTGTILHLIEPLGFNLRDTKLRRAGLDYHDMAHVVLHESFEDMVESMPHSRIIAFTAYAKKQYTEVQYKPTDILLFGPEPGNIPDPMDIFFGSHVAEQVRLPMLPARRSLNLTNTASIAVYEAWRQLGFAGGQ